MTKKICSICQTPISSGNETTYRGEPACVGCKQAVLEDMLL